MSLGRNDPCSCGSGKKYKRCCMEGVSKQHANVSEDMAHIVAMNPHLSLDELRLAAQRKLDEQNHRPMDDFCGLSPEQVYNWLYAPFGEFAGVIITPPDDLSPSPVMRYLSLILEEAMQQGGSFKATPKGNLPTKLVKHASALLPEFAVSQYHAHISISEFAGRNEEAFNALHYTRILAEAAGIIYRRSGRYHVKKTAQKQYQPHGLHGFFLPMLEAAVTKYNWGYLDGWPEEVDLRMFWLFMLWRLRCHGSVDRLANEVATAFPDVLRELSADEHFPPMRLLRMMIASRFVGRFLQFWGFVTMDPKRMFIEAPAQRVVDIQPLLTQTFDFKVTPAL
ncbi:SecC motif-containing protein [Halomonas alkaliantarctica]|nr:SecC motif-containing protein [Halomonas alkaliantarctica]